METDIPVIAVKGVSKHFTKPLDLADRVANLVGAGITDEIVRAVSDVDLVIRPSEVVALVGESGCGKSTLGRIVAGILTPTKGQILYRGVDIVAMDAAERKATALKVQMIFQNPSNALNPRMRVRDIVAEAPKVHGVVPTVDLDEHVAEMLQRVGMDPSFNVRFPHQLSGGQRQRVGIARALAVKPEVVVCDEAVASLDVSIQAQVLNLFMELREEFQLTYLFISHDLGVVQHLSDWVAIMYLGRIVETASATEIFRAPNHPYAQALIAEMPQIDNRQRAFSPIEGEIASPLDPPPGCHFHPRCPHASARCREEAPKLKEISSGHMSACHLNDAP
jgi:peptide/nickel transport system ATP-binding protein